MINTYQMCVLLEIKQSTSNIDQLKEDNEKAAWSRHQNLPKKKLKIAILPREVTLFMDNKNVKIK